MNTAIHYKSSYYISNLHLARANNMDLFFFALCALFSLQYVEFKRTIISCIGRGVLTQRKYIICLYFNMICFGKKNRNMHVIKNNVNLCSILNK